MDGHDELGLRRPAEHARRALEAHEAAAASQAHVSRLRQEHKASMDELHKLAKAGAAEAELTAQARQVRLAAEALRAAKAESTRLQAELVERIS